MFVVAILMCMTMIAMIMCSTTVQLMGHRMRVVLTAVLVWVPCGRGRICWRWRSLCRMRMTRAVLVFIRRVAVATHLLRLDGSELALVLRGEFHFFVTRSAGVSA